MLKSDLIPRSRQHVKSCLIIYRGQSCAMVAGGGGGGGGEWECIP